MGSLIYNAHSSLVYTPTRGLSNLCGIFHPIPPKFLNFILKILPDPINARLIRNKIYVDEILLE